MDGGERRAQSSGAVDAAAAAAANSGAACDRRRRSSPRGGRRPRLHVAIALLVVGVLAGGAAGVHHDGDFVHTARRAQFLKKRTQWHDLIEHHCPRFGRTRIVALPIQRPVAGSAAGGKPNAAAEDVEVSDYRIQLSFDGDRVVTPWLTVIGGGARGGDGNNMPLVEVTLRRAGDELRGARARVVPLPDALLLQHPALYDDFKNASHWPKHVMVRYHFAAEGGADLARGLYVLLVAGLTIFVALGISTLAGAQGKVAAFVRDAVGADGDPLLAVGPAVGGYGGGYGGAAAAAAGAGAAGLGGGGAGGYGGPAVAVVPPPYFHQKGAHAE